MNEAQKLEQLRRNEEFKQTMSKEELTHIARSLDEHRLNRLHAEAQTKSKLDYFLNRDFYLVLTMTNDPTTKEPKDFVIARRSCPTPGYNQNVFKYHYQSSELEYLWTIPKKNLYWHFWKHRQFYLQHYKWKKMCSFVCLMESGQMLEWCKKENGELKDAVIKINNPQPA